MSCNRRACAGRPSSQAARASMGDSRRRRRRSHCRRGARSSGRTRRTTARSSPPTSTATDAAEVLGRQSQGLVAYRFDDSVGQFEPIQPAIGATPIFTDAEGWDQPRHYRTIQAADLDGDGSDEVFGASSQVGGLVAYGWDTTSRTWVALPLLQAFVSPAAAPPARPTPADLPLMYATIQAADLDGDGRAEVLGRTDEGISVYSLENGQWQQRNPIAWPEVAELPSYYETIQTADLDGDGAAEVLGRTSRGLVAFTNDGGLGWSPLPLLEHFNDANGWIQTQYGATIQTGDLDGNGRARRVRALCLRHRGLHLRAVQRRTVASTRAADGIVHRRRRLGPGHLPPVHHRRRPRRRRPPRDRRQRRRRPAGLAPGAIDEVVDPARHRWPLPRRRRVERPQFGQHGVRRGRRRLVHPRPGLAGAPARRDPRTRSHRRRDLPVRSRHRIVRVTVGHVSRLRLWCGGDRLRRHQRVPGQRQRQLRRGP